jgi:hypothetical protein
MTYRVDIAELQPSGLKMGGALLRAPYAVLIGLCCLGAFASAVFILSSLYALAVDWALPTTALIRWSAVAQWAARNEPQLGYLLLMLAGIGGLSTWVARLTGHSLDAAELELRRVLVWCGFPIAVCAFVFSISAMWAGVLRQGDLNNTSIGGLIPFNDAAGYFASANDQVKDGVWNWISSHRPLAGAFESVLLFFAGYSLPAMLILQACAVAAAAWFATLAIAHWRGVWAGIAFFALTYIYCREFVSTTTTEPLGLFWALLSIPFFIDAFRSGSARPALVAFAMTAVALVTRMGSMFTIPALMLWMVWQFGEGRIAKLRILAASTGILIGLFGLNFLLQKLYGFEQGTLGGNFAYTICGLSIGTSWGGCLSKLAALGIPATETPAVLKQLYAIAWENFRAHPNVAINRLFAAMGAFSWNFRGVLWAGYSGIEMPHWLWQKTLTWLSLLGLCSIAMFRTRRIEFVFWPLLAASIYLSAAIVYFDDGARVMAVSHPLIALFFAAGLAGLAPAPTEALPSKESWRYGAGGLVLAALLFTAVPFLAHHFSAGAGGEVLRKDGEAIVYGGRRLSGFLVVDDSQPLRGDVPTLHIADFKAIIEQSSIEYYQGLLQPVMPPLPFGFVIAPRLEKDGVSTNQFIVPADVFEHSETSVWRFQFVVRNQKPGMGPFWLFVTKAEPWDAEPWDADRGPLRTTPPAILRLR